MQMHDYAWKVHRREDVLWVVMSVRKRVRKGKKVGTGGETMRNSEVRPEGMAIMYATGTHSLPLSNFNTAQSKRNQNNNPLVNLFFFY